VFKHHKLLVQATPSPFFSGNKVQLFQKRGLVLKSLEKGAFLKNTMLLNKRMTSENGDKNPYSLDLFKQKPALQTKFDFYLIQHPITNHSILDHGLRHSLLLQSIAPVESTRHPAIHWLPNCLRFIRACRALRFRRELQFLP
jgi:hypothetical protein